VLIVDESPANRAKLATHLSDHRWTVHEADSGRAGLDLAEKGASIVVVDEKLPDMTGVDFRTALKAKSDLRRIPVIVISTENLGSSDTWDEDAEIYLTKPINLQELVATMKGLFQLGVAAAKSVGNLTQLSLMIDSMMEGVITVSRDGRILTMNPAARKIYGWSNAELLPRDLDEMDSYYERLRLDGAPLPRHEWPVFRAMRGEIVRGHEIRISNRATGRTWIGSFNATPLREHGGRHDLIILTVFDVTARKADEAELERKVLERTSSLREAINQMEEFSYTVSHDLRAPLRSIKGYAEVLANDHANKLKGEAASFLERIIENGNRMERLVNDVLTMSRISSTKVRLEPIDLNALLQAIVREYPNLQANIAQITIDPLPMVNGHESLCTQVFANLLGNAAKFVPVGTVPKIHVWVEPHGEYVRLNVRDNGIGIAAEFHQKIFGMFERLDPENHFGGTGIGLAIVRRAAEKMNGRVGLESTEGQGSLFWVDLPKATA
jgi:PAS domain S-box-containing protein